MTRMFEAVTVHDANTFVWYYYAVIQGLELSLQLEF